MKMSDGTYQELAWLYDVYNNEEYPNEVKVFLELFDIILQDRDISALEWFMVNKEHITRKKYRKHNVDDIFDKWEGKPCPETVTRFTQQEENKAIRRLRRKQQALKYLQLAYELGV